MSPAQAPRRPQVSRAVRRVLTAVLAMLVLVGATVAAPAGTAQAATRITAAGGLSGTTELPAVAGSVVPADNIADTEDDEAAGQVHLSVTSLAPEVVSTGEDVTVAGTITNHTDQTLTELTLVIQVQPRTEVTTNGLASWLADEQDTPLTTVALQTLQGQVAPGAELDFRVTVSSDDLPLTGTDQWGPRGVQVALTQGYTTLTQDRTILLWNPGVRVSPTRVTAFVPVTASPAELTALVAATPNPDAEATPTASATGTTESTGAADAPDAATGDASSAQTLAALRERVLGLLSLAGDGIVLAVDPLLLRALGLNSATRDSTTASDSATASAGATSSATPGSDPAATDLTELALSLASALETGDVVALPWADADLTALAHQGESALIESALERTATSEAAQSGASTSVFWSAGALDRTTLTALPESVTTVVAAPGDAPVAVDLTYTPSGTMTLDGRTVLIPDAGLSAAAGGILVTDQGEMGMSNLDALQLLRGQTAILTRQAPALSRDIVVAVPRAAAAVTDPEVLAKRLNALINSTWTEPRNLDSLLASAADAASAGTEVMRVELPDSSSGEGEVTAMTLSAARDASTRLKSVGSILTDPERALGLSTDVLALTSSATWRADEGACTTMISKARTQGETVTGSLAAAPSSTINLISSAADLPVRIVSSLDQDVTVQVHLTSSSTRLQTNEDITVTVPARGQVTASVPVTAVGSGNVDLTIQLNSKDGTSVGTPSTVHLRVRADWENVGTRVLSGILVFLLVAGIVRTVRRGRRTATPRERR
ncbi:DUF6049 family protein [Actinomyces sp.]|uniref:DUF6049 family protein n=1 Tax=Actinomyces sp. TaxID=29317 RepID=UPI0026DAF4BB|nr:DUF6049 family protein [Actinomyces sp.]MDO4900727.1 DUF6049 family protein [Actinomyces sp.]